MSLSDTRLEEGYVEDPLSLSALHPVKLESVLSDDDLVEELDEDNAEYIVYESPMDAAEGMLDDVGEGDDQDELYNCSTCGINFHSVMDHIKEYHADQEVVVEMDGDLNEADALIKIEPQDIKHEVTNKNESSTVQGELANKDGPGNDPTKQVRKNKFPDTHECLYCTSVFASVKALASHVRVVHKPRPQKFVPNIDPKPKTTKPYECSVCNTVFPSNKSLRLHVRMHEPVKSKPYDEAMEFHMNDSQTERETFFCSVCGKSYDKNFEKMHMLMHSDAPKYNCDICNKKFNNEASLSMHSNAHQGKQVAIRAPSKKSQNAYACSYCGREFSRPHEKVKHERIHTGEKPHVCEICGKSFRVSYCLTLHIRTHTGARPYVCPHCNKRFKAHSVYNHHLMTHSDARNYQCTLCPKAFKTSVQLAGHRNSHLKPFSCTECNRPFATLYAVRLHMETHKKPNHNLKYKCLYCGATYARSFALRDHLKELHNSLEYQEVEEIFESDLINAALVIGGNTATDTNLQEDTIQIDTLDSIDIIDPIDETQMVDREDEHEQNTAEVDGNADLDDNEEIEIVFNKDEVLSDDNEELPLSDLENEEVVDEWPDS